MHVPLTFENLLPFTNKLEYDPALIGTLTNVLSTILFIVDVERSRLTEYVELEVLERMQFSMKNDRT